MKTIYVSTRITLVFVLTFLFTVYVNSQSFQWVKKAGGTYSDGGMAVAVDNSNNVYIAGFFGLTAGFDNDSITAAGNYDVFVAKYNESGTVQWVRQAGGGSDDIASDIATDASGNIYVTGYYTGAAIFGEDTLICYGEKDIFIAKYTSSGICEWAVSAGGIGNDEGNSLCVDASGNVYVIGYFYNGANFGSIALTSYGVNDIFIAKCNTNGVWQWAQKAGSSAWDNGMGISIDDAGNLYITGYYGDYYGQPAHFGTFDLPIEGTSDIFTAKCNNSGNFLWAVKGGGTGADIGNDIVTDASGNSFVIGYFSGTVTFGTQTLTSDGPDDYFIAKYNASGNLEWLRQAGGTGYFKGNGISINASNQVYITGTFDGTAVFGDTTLTSMYVDNVFILKYDDNGNFYWAQQAKGSYYHVVQDVNNENADVYITGNLNQQAWFDCFFIESSGSFGGWPTCDIFVAKLNDFINTSKSISSSPFCAGENVSIPFTADYDFDPANIFTAQLSDLTGCFDNPVSIGTLTGTTSGAINATIPQNTATGTTYRIRIVSSDPYIIGSDNGFNLTINPAVITDAGTDRTIIAGDSVQIGSNPVTGYTYIWSPAKGLNSTTVAQPWAKPDTATIYYLTVTDGNGCSSTDKVQLSIICFDFTPTPQPCFPWTSLVCSGNTVTFINGSSGLTQGCMTIYYTDNTNYFVITCQNYDFTSYMWTPNLQTGNYGFVMVYDPTNLNCCDPWSPPYNPSYVSSGNFDHTGINFVNAEAGPNDVACIGEPYTLQGSGGLSTYSTYSWTPATGLNNPNIANPVILSPLISTTYALSIYTYYTSLSCSEDCYSTDNVTITVNPLPIANAGPDQTICTGQTAYLSATGGNSYQWSTGASTQNISVSPTVTTTYTVTVTANGCTASDDVTVFVGPIPNADAGPDQSICSGTTVTLTASGGGASFLWNTGAATANINVTPTTTTTYTVTVTNAYGCSASDNVTVIVTIIPSATFSADPEITCMGSGITFQCTGINDPSSTFNWNFNDGTTATGQSVTHTFNEPGYYNVTLSVNNNCGSACTSQYITIIPSVIGSTPATSYNAYCCSETQISYSTTITTGLTYDPFSGNFTVQTGTPVYINSGTYHIKGIIDVPSLSTLYINVGVIMEFGPMGKIIVEPGGKLYLIHCTLQGLTDCNTMWQGIEVWGNSTLSQANQNDQGYIEVTKGTIIRDAHTAVLLGKTRLCINTLCSICKSKLQYDLKYSGGIIDALDNATFNNNAIDIKFMPYYYSNTSKIFGCFFNGGALLDPGYSPTFTTYTYNTYSIHNPFYPQAEGRTSAGIYLWNVKDVALADITTGQIGNNFTNMDNGIKSFDAKYNVTGSSFTNVANGIAIYNIVPSVLNRHIIGGSLAKANSFNIFQNSAIWDESGLHDFINNNFFGDPFTLQSDNNYGIYMRNSSGFEISDNNFDNMLTGINVVNSATGGGLISNRVRPENGNVFTKCKMSFYTSLNNLYLQNRCNRCINPDPAYYTRNWEIFGKLANQGKYDVNDISNVKNPAGNDFSLSSYKEIKSNNFGFTYYSHLDNSKIPTTPNSKITIHSNTWFDHINSCKRKIVNLVTIVGLKNKISTLSSEFTNVYNNLDKGQTLQLLAAINSNMSEGNLKNKLINASPLSDTVLIAVIVRINQLSPGNFKNVIVPNSPVSDTVKSYLDVKLITLPPGIAKQIKDAQVINPSYRTLTTIKTELNTAITERTLAVNELISRWITNDSVQSAIDLLKNEHTDNSFQILASISIIENNYTIAQQYLDSISSVEQEIQDWKILMQKIIDLSVDSSTVFEITNADEQLIRYYAAQTPATIVTSNAQAILRLIYGEDFPIDILSDLKVTNEIDTNISYMDTFDFIGENIPNPFTSTTIISYNLPENTESAILYIYTITGQMVKTYTLQKDSDKLEISLKEYQSGVYLYGISINGSMKQYKRMVLIK